ncbi:MAG: hypothetical protein VKM92_08270 [Cyanobacteriota bacterium]|nr:hypothetical protein [Cyanobacteriota bacterium]
MSTNPAPSTTPAPTAEAEVRQALLHRMEQLGQRLDHLLALTVRRRLP